MKTKGLVFVSCLAAGALIAAQTTQVMSHNQNISARSSGTRYYGGTRYVGTRSYAGRQYTGTRYYGGTGYYGNYYGGTPYYYGGGWGSSSVWPYVAASAASSFWAPGYGRYPYSYYGGYPYNYSYYGGYPYNYSYYGSGSGYGYGYAGSTVAAVQQRLGRLGYYHGVVDGVIGPRTSSAIAAFQSRNGLIVDGTISRPLLNRLGLA
jgi:hypothetical protein